MTWDLVVRGGKVIDGTGMGAFGADVAIQDGRVARVGRVTEAAKKTIDADGCWVTPGFIDIHTHYDVQLDWDPLATPSSWHGVTTALAGNCGFTLAPAKPAGRRLAGWNAFTRGRNVPRRTRRRTSLLRR